MKTRVLPRPARWIGSYCGVLEYLDATCIRGWCLGSGQPRRPLTVQIYLCGIRVGKVRCDGRRPDLAPFLKQDALGGFRFGWDQCDRSALRHALAKLRGWKWDADVTQAIEVRVAGGLFRVNPDYLKQFCRPLSVGRLYAALAWQCQLESSPPASIVDPTTASADGAILIVLHDTRKFGAQLFMVRYAEWLRERAAHLRLEFLVTTERPSASSTDAAPDSIAARLSRLGPVYYLDAARCPENLDRFERNAYRLLYLNSLGSLYCLGQLPRSKAPMLIHVHELRWAAGFLVTPEMRQRLSNSTARYVACSAAVRDMLVDDYAVPAERVDLVHSFVPAGDALHAEPTHAPRATAQTGAPPTVLIAGSVNWRKGGYLLAAIARRLQAVSSVMPRFVWVGDLFEKNCVGAMRHEFAQLGLADALDLAGHQEDMATYYARADLLLLPSIEDPFPLVMMEAGLAGLPVVAFDGSGGASEFIGRDGGGVVVPHLDVQRMADAVHALLVDPGLRERLGRNARATAMQFTDVVQGPKLLAVIEAATQPLPASDPQPVAPMR